MKYDLPSDQTSINNYKRYQELILKGDLRTTSENTELNNIQTTLSPYLINAIDFNNKVENLEFQQTKNNLGDKTKLTTVNNDNIVNAINELGWNYNTYSSSIDSNGIYTILQYKKMDGTLFMKSTLSGGTSPNYTTDTWVFYDIDGTTVKSTIKWTLTYDNDGKVISKVVTP